MHRTARWFQRKIVVIPAALLFAALGSACTGNTGDTGTAVESEETAVAEEGEVGIPSEEEETQAQPGVYKFGQTVKFKDGSTLTVGKPVKFTPDEYAVTGEKKPVYVKFKSTFANNTKTIFDPALTSASASGGGEEGESVYQDGLDAPENKILPGKSVTWWMGYGVKSQQDLQLEITLGFLDDYGTVIFTN
jgi:hypothetical protein